MKLNKKGYMLIEIILASAIAFGVGYFILQMVINLKNKNDDLLVKTLTTTDQTIILNKIMERAKEESNDFTCNITAENNTIYYEDKDGNKSIIDIVNDYATVGTISCSHENNNLYVSIPLDVEQLSDEYFDVVLNYNTEDETVSIPSTPTNPQNDKTYKITFDCGDNAYWNRPSGSNIITASYDEYFSILPYTVCVDIEGNKTPYGWRIGSHEFYSGSTKFSDLVANNWVSKDATEAVFSAAWEYKQQVKQAGQCGACSDDRQCESIGGTCSGTCIANGVMYQCCVTRNNQCN